MDTSAELARSKKKKSQLKPYELDQIAINVKSHELLKKLLSENPLLEEILRSSANEIEALVGIKNWMLNLFEKKPQAYNYYANKAFGRGAFKKLKWSDYAIIRILDYVDNAGKEYTDRNLRKAKAVSNPIKMLWLAVNKGTGGAKPAFFEDMLFLFRQLNGRYKRTNPSKEKINQWMERYPSGLDPRIIRLREENRDRIIRVILTRMEKGEIRSNRFKLDADMSSQQKYLKVLKWWNDPKFHLHFAVRSPDVLDEMLGFSLDPDTMKILYQAEKKGIPFFVNPYYISLLHVRAPYFAIGADLAIRDYVLYSQHLVNEFGHIIAWEGEDKVEPGKPNAAGWILPTQHNIHRRYPEVAILIPDTAGRACGGLCASCQRMYDFQNGHLNFNLDKLKPEENWNKKLIRLMEYWENDSQLRDILITGGDALMNTDQSLKRILDAVYEMAIRKKEKNKSRPAGKKYAEIVRVRLGTRLPVYIPQRITAELAVLLRNFKQKASKIGIKQFVIQTHFESPMEVTPETVTCVNLLLSAGWIVTNQHVLTTSSSRRGHRAKLRQILNDIGVLSYYTFTVKGYMENYHSFATSARSVQEQAEEKSIGKIPDKYLSKIRDFPLKAENIKQNIRKLREEANLPFLASDRNVLNLPGVGKSLTFRVIGITRYGRRILQFSYDNTRNHSPIISKMGKVIIIEPKSIKEYLVQLQEMGEDNEEYKSIWGYSIGETETRMPIYEYPEYDFKVTDILTNLKIKGLRIHN